VFTFTNFIVVPNKRKACNLLFAFSVSLGFCRIVSAERHHVDWGLASVFWLTGCGGRRPDECPDERRDERPDELSSVL